MRSLKSWLRSSPRIKDKNTKLRSLNRVNYKISLLLVYFFFLISAIIATPEIFPTYFHMDHRTIPIRATCRFYKSPPYQDATNTPPLESATFTPLGLSDPLVPLLYTRLPHRPSIIVPNTVTTTYPPALGLAGSQIRYTTFPRQRIQLPPRS
jgi:hypothetical protein